MPFGWVDALSGRDVNWFGEAFYEYPEREGDASLDGEEEVHPHLRLIHLDLWRGAGFALWDGRRVEAIKTLDRLRFLRTGWALQHPVLPPETSPAE